MPIHDVAPRAVRIADAIDAINCTTNLAVSFLLILPPFSYYWGQSPKIKLPLGLIVTGWTRDDAAASAGIATAVVGA